MSAKIEVQTTIRDLRLCEDAVNNLGFKFEKVNGKLEIKRNYHNIVISDNGHISFDDMDKKMISQIKTEYNKLHIVNEAEMNGELYEIVENDQEIRITVG